MAYAEPGSRQVGAPPALRRDSFPPVARHSQDLRNARSAFPDDAGRHPARAASGTTPSRWLLRIAVMALAAVALSALVANRNASHSRLTRDSSRVN